VIKRLPFDHNKSSFSEAVGVGVEELNELVERPEKFDGLELSKRLRVVSALGNIVMRMFTDSIHPSVKLFFHLTFDFEDDPTYSKHVELIENNLLKLMEEGSLDERMLKNIFLGTIHFLKLFGYAMEMVTEGVNRVLH